jgi:hypothetical protein
MKTTMTMLLAAGLVTGCADDMADVGDGDQGDLAGEGTLERHIGIALSGPDQSMSYASIVEMDQKYDLNGTTPEVRMVVRGEIHSRCRFEIAGLGEVDRSLLDVLPEQDFEMEFWQDLGAPRSRYNLSIEPIEISAPLTFGDTVVDIDTTFGTGEPIALQGRQAPGAELQWLWTGEYEATVGDIDVRSGDEDAVEAAVEAIAGTHTITLLEFSDRDERPSCDELLSLVDAGTAAAE